MARVVGGMISERCPWRGCFELCECAKASPKTLEEKMQQGVASARSVLFSISTIIRLQESCIINALKPFMSQPGIGWTVFGRQSCKVSQDEDRPVLYNAASTPSAVSSAASFVQ